jgi:uncharacterized membrane protein
METKLRTFLKVIILRIIVFIIISLSTVFIFQASLFHAIEFAILDVVVEFLTHYIYDRIWIRIKWGLIEQRSTKEEVIEVPKDDNNIVAFTI